MIYPIHDIPLTKGKIAKVSHEDFAYNQRAAVLFGEYANLNAVI